MRGPEFTRISSRVLKPRLPCIGNIKIGGKGEQRGSGKNAWRLPTKLDHFRITKRARDKKTDNFIIDQELHEAIGAKPTELNVRLMFNEPEENFQTSFLAYEGRTKRRCQGNGVEAFDYELQQKIPCTCPLLKQHEGGYDGPARPVGDVHCKPYGVLSVLLDEAASYGGFHVFRTTSWESISSITAALDRFRSDFGGLAFIPFRLVMYPSTDTYEEGGQSGTSTSYKVALVLRGTVETAYQIAAGAAEQRQAALQLSSGQQKQPEYTPEDHAEQLRTIAAEDAGDVGAEFYPEGEDADFEVVEDDEEDEVDPRIAETRELCRRALAIAKVDPIKAQQSLLKYEDKIDELATYIVENKPDAWAEAMQDIADEAALERERQSAAQEQSDDAETAGAGAGSLDLFGSG